MRFEWNEEKNQINIAKHGISLESATAVFNDPDIYEWHDVKHSGYNGIGEWEDRYIAMGWVNKVLFVVYTVRERDHEEIIRLISARRAMRHEVKEYFNWVESRY